MPAARFSRRLLGRSPRLELWLLSSLLVLLSANLLLWSGYLWLGQRVQAAAEAGAAAAAGSALAADERERLARRAVAVQLSVDARSLASHVVVRERPDGLAVQVSYDASHWPIYQLRRVLPAPPPRSVVKVALAAR